MQGKTSAGNPLCKKLPAMAGAMLLAANAAAEFYLGTLLRDSRLDIRAGSHLNVDDLAHLDAVVIPAPGEDDRKDSPFLRRFAERGGTVTCGTFANATGALTLSGDATIDLGDGSLSFADSSGETWAAGATLNITGKDSLPTRTLRFGTDSSGLTPTQLKQIRYNGGKVSLNSEGYLSGPKGLIISYC